ncbi:MAG TPA: ABC transporter permease [Bacteroidota bacterium]|nr:ABC transporter permease [Bacteroidota bacterium]
MSASLYIIIEIIRKEFYQIRHDRRMLAVSIVAPILQVFLLGYAATTDIKNSTMVVCDMDRTAESRALIESFTTSGYFIAAYRVEKPEDATPYIERARANIVLVVPRGFARKLLRHEPAQVQVLLDGTDANTANILLTYASQIVSTYGRRISAEYATMVPGSRFPQILPEPRVWFNPDLKSSNYMVPGVVAMVLMIITMTLTSVAVVKEREAGTLEQLLVTPIKPYELLLGKLIPFVVIGFVDALLVLAVAHYWFEVPLAGSVALLFGLSAIFLLTTLGLGLFISTIAKSQGQAMMIAQFFFFMPFIFLSGFTFPIANMPEWIQVLTYLIPLRYFLEIVRGIFLKGTDLTHLWPQALALLGFGVAILSLSVKRFRQRLE